MIIAVCAEMRSPRAVDQLQLAGPAGRGRREAQIEEPADLAAAAHDRVEDQAAEEAQEGEDHQAGGEDRGREARHQAGLEIGDRERDGEDHGERRQEQAEAAVEQDRPLDPVEMEDRLQDPPAVALGRELGDRALGPRAVSGDDLADRHGQLERVDADLGLGLEAARQRREGS